MSFCGLTKRISSKICILSVHVKINKRSFEPLCVWIWGFCLFISFCLSLWLLFFVCFFFVCLFVCFLLFVLFLFFSVSRGGIFFFFF